MVIATVTILQALVAANVPQPPSVLEGALQAARSLEEDVAQQENLEGDEVKLPDQGEWDGYGIGDAILGKGPAQRIRDGHARKWPGSIAGKYAALFNKKYNNPGKTVKPDWELVCQVADEHCKGTKQWKGLAVHVRGGDMIAYKSKQEQYFCSKFIPTSCYEDATKLGDDVWEGAKDGILVVTGNHINKKFFDVKLGERKTKSFVTDVLETLQKQTDKPIEFASSTPDDDFCTLYKALHFMPGPGGFGNVISLARNHKHGESTFDYGWWEDKCSTCSQFFQNNKHMTSKGKQELYSSFQQAKIKK